MGLESKVEIESSPKEEGGGKGANREVSQKEMKRERGVATGKLLEREEKGKPTREGIKAKLPRKSEE